MIDLTSDRLTICIERPAQASEALFNYQQALISAITGQELTADERFALGDLLREMSLTERQIQSIVSIDFELAVMEVTS